MLNEAGLILAKDTVSLCGLLLDQNDTGRITLGEWMREKIAETELALFTQIADTVYVRELFLIQSEKDSATPPNGKLFNPDTLE